MCYTLCFVMFKSVQSVALYIIYNMRLNERKPLKTLFMAFYEV